MRQFVLGVVLLISPLVSCTKRATEIDPVTEMRQRLLQSPTSPRTLTELAESYLKSGDYLRAGQYARLAERLQAQGAVPSVEEYRLFQLSVLTSIRAHQYSSAMQRCLLWVGSHPSDPEPRQLLATLLEGTDNEPAAERQWRMLVALNPQDGRFLLELARFYQRSSRTDKHRLAKQTYEKYLETSPSSTAVAQVKAALLEIEQLEPSTQE